MGVRFSRYDPGEQWSSSPTEQMRRAVDALVDGYVGFGWTIAERQQEPLRVRLVYRLRRRGRTPWSNEARDTGERVVWVDETGEVRVAPVGEEPA